MIAESNSESFTFEISLSVLNHLGRNLYRSFVTVLGEAISNAWDADADDVWIDINHEQNSFTIKDNGFGMTTADFQNKFLKIGYTKRQNGINKTPRKRPFIGRKGIGKLALLSCAQKVSVLSKVEGGEYIGGVIDNSGLDKAITEDLTPQEYALENVEPLKFASLVEGHKKGTIILFEGVEGGIKNTIEYLKKIIALNFRFSLVDKSFSIYLNGEKVGITHLSELSENSQLLWEIGKVKDPFVQKLRERVLERENLSSIRGLSGFICSVSLPKHLKIRETKEKVTIDLFVNGRLREKDLLKHIPTTRIVESYLYGQIHYNQLDVGKKDRFTSSREGIIADDPKFKELLEELQKNVIPKILNRWDEWRRKHKKDGDPDNPDLTQRDRKSEELFNIVSGAYSPGKGSANKKLVDGWISNLAEEARFNFGSYAECFISENLIRNHINHKRIELSKEAEKEIERWKKREQDSRDAGNISIQIRQNNSDLSYLDMKNLSNLVDKDNEKKKAGLYRDATEYKPIRDALAHTALLTDSAKKKLTSVYENIKGRLISILENYQ